MPSFLTKTLGCKVNQYETEYLRQGLLRAGYREAGQGEQADLCIVNTCTVTLESDYKSRKLIRALARKNPRAEIVVMGCYATRAAEEVAGLPGVVEVVTDKRRLPELAARFGARDAPAGIARFDRLHRAYVKVQDGCRMECSYCIVPRVRPVLWSRPVDEVLDEIRRLVEHGHLEMVLTGIHLGHYGFGLTDRQADGRPIDLAHLLDRVLSLPGEFRVRLSSLEAAELSPVLITLMAENPERICPHLHIPVQSGSDAVLARMRRRGGIRQLVDTCRRVQAALDRPALTTDVIVGFPGETEADFQATCRAVEEAGFSKVHVFRFSARQGTPAAAMPDQVPAPVKQRRAAQLGEIGRRLREQYCRGLVGRELGVLVESPAKDSPGMLVGTADRYVPVELPAGPDRLDRLVRVTAGQAVGGRIRAAGPIHGPR